MTRSIEIRRYLAGIGPKLQHATAQPAQPDAVMNLTICRLALIAIAGSSPASAADEYGVMSAEKLRTNVVGNTMIGEDASGQIWSEYFDPSGELRGDDGTHGIYPARYTITENFLCFDYSGDSFDWCGQVFAEGSRIKFVRNDEFVRFLRAAIIVPGNPMAF
jgi:hypothetical protein